MRRRSSSWSERNLPTRRWWRVPSFLAAEAARKSLNSASVDRAISLFEDVYKLGGPLKFQARLEQATTMRQTKQEREAIVLLDDLLTQNPPTDIRYQALDGKGEALFTLAANEPKMYEEAIKYVRYAHLERRIANRMEAARYLSKRKMLREIGQDG